MTSCREPLPPTPSDGHAGDPHRRPRPGRRGVPLVARRLHRAAAAVLLAAAAVGAGAVAAVATAPAPSVAATVDLGPSAATGLPEGVPLPGQPAGLGRITYTLHVSASPSEDEADAYWRIRAAMDAATEQYNQRIGVTRHLDVHYAPWVATADGNINGTIRFGAGRGFMTKRTAMHEISHTLGVGTAWRWQDLCQQGRYTGSHVVALAQCWGEPPLSCGGGHFWPYGLNYEDELDDVSAVRHVQVVNAMHADGL